MWNSTKYDEALLAFMSRLLTELGEKDNSPLYGRIILGDKTKNVNTCISLDTVIVYGFKKSTYFAKLNKKKLVSTGHLWLDPKKADGTFEYRPMLKKSYLFFRTYFDHIKEKTENIWNLGSGPGGFVAMNIGIVCFIRIASDILDHIKNYESEDFSSKSGKDIAELTFLYLEPIFKYINSFESQKIDQFRKYGTNPSALENGVREFQREVHNQFNNFDPEGLQQWIDDNSGRFNDIVKMAAGSFEVGIKNKVYKILQDKFEDNWWKAVPPDIQKKASNDRIDDGGEDPDSEFLCLIDYKKIISRHWDICKTVFADPHIRGSKKDDLLEWFDKLNPIRNRQAHYRKITSEHYEFIKQLNDWLPERLEIKKLEMSE